MSQNNANTRTPEQLLLTAIHKKDAGRVKDLLENGANARASAIKGTPLEVLHIASQSNQPDVIEMLIAHGADVNAVSSINSPPLLYAILNRAQEAFDTLLDHGADPNVTDGFGIPALCCAVTGNSKPMYNRLLDMTEDLNATDQNEGTVLLRMAEQNGWSREFADLHRRGARLTVTEKRGYNALHFAARKDVHEITSYLLEHAPGLALKRNEDGLTPLHMAMNRPGPSKSLGMILDALPAEKLTRELKQDLLFYAVARQHPDGAEEILKAGADIHAPDRDGLSAIQIACARNLPGAVPVLLKHGAKLYHNGDGTSPIELADRPKTRERLHKMHVAHVAERTKRIRRKRRKAPAPY